MPINSSTLTIVLIVIAVALIGWMLLPLFTRHSAELRAAPAYRVVCTILRQMTFAPLSLQTPFRTAADVIRYVKSKSSAAMKFIYSMAREKASRAAMKS